MNEPVWIKRYKTNLQKISDYINKLEYSYQNDKGYIFICQLYDSIYLWANDVYMRCIPCEQMENYNYIKINICLEGNCEVQVADGRYVYLDSGLVSISTNQSNGFYQYPSKRYRGLELAFDIEKLKRQMVPILADLDLSADELINIAEKEGGSYIGRANTDFIEISEHIYQELMLSNKSIFDYRYYLIQILYGMRNGGMIQDEKKFYLTRGQREIAQAAEKIMTQDLSIRHSIEKLSEQYKVSPSSLKKYFETYFGNPVSEYMRRKRLEEGKRRLVETTESVIEIATKVGYNSQGKFCSVFKSEIGVTPLEYRRLSIGGKNETK